jgi:hypothetical protein
MKLILTGPPGSTPRRTSGSDFAYGRISFGLILLKAQRNVSACARELESDGAPNAATCRR